MTTSIPTTSIPTNTTHLEEFLDVPVLKQLLTQPAGAAGRLHHPDRGTLFWFRAHAPAAHAPAPAAPADAAPGETDDACAVYATSSMLAYRTINDFVLDGWDSTCPVYKVTDTQLVKAFDIGLPMSDDDEVDEDEILDRQICDAQAAVEGAPIGTVLVAGDVRSTSSSDFVVIELRDDGWWTHSCGPDWSLDSLDGEFDEAVEDLSRTELRDAIRHGSLDTHLAQILPNAQDPQYPTTITVLPYPLHR